jgi:hypothetical protein
MSFAPDLSARQDQLRDAALAQDWARRLREGGTAFKAGFLPLEQVFLATGDRLQQLHRRVRGLSGAAEGAAARLSAAEFAEMVRGFSGVASHIAGLHGSGSGLARTLEGIVQTTDTMLSVLSALSRTMFHVKVLAVNGKIEASQLDATGIDFTVFTTSILHLAQSGEQTIAAVGRELAVLRAAAVQAHGLQAQFESRGLTELEAVGSRLAKAVHDLQDRQQRASQAVHDLPHRLESLFAQVGKVVSALQVFDITRQRLEHVEQALVLAADMVEQEAGTAMDLRQLRIFVNGIADLQSSQLGHAEQHYGGEIREVGRSLDAMAGGVPAIEALCDQAFGGGAGGGSGGGAGSGGLSLLAVEAEIKKAAAIFVEYTGSRHQAEDSMSRVVAAAGQAGELMKSLNSVNAEMRLMGLNASIKCGNLGERGRALNVIAQELQSYAGHTRQQVELGADCLVRITQAAHDIGSAGTAGREDRVAALQSELDRAEGRLRAIGADLAAQLQTIAGQAAEVVALTRESAKGFARADCGDAMRRTVGALKSLAAESHPGLSGPELEAARREVLAFSQAHYTMAAERSIHGAAVGGEALINLLTGQDVAADAASAGAADAEPDISGLLF